MTRMQAGRRWAIELNASEHTLNVWQRFLKPPFDPFIEDVDIHNKNVKILRSDSFCNSQDSNEINKTGKKLLSLLNIIMKIHADLDIVTDVSVLDFVDVSSPRRAFFDDVEEKISASLDLSDPLVTDGEGNTKSPIPAESPAQSWLRAAMSDSEISSALRYLGHNSGWAELYRAYEAVKNKPCGTISNNEITRFRITANHAERHHPNDKRQPHSRPMQLWEARALIKRWVSAAIEDVLAQNP